MDTGHVNHYPADGPDPGTGCFLLVVVLVGACYFFYKLITLL